MVSCFHMVVGAPARVGEKRRRHRRRESFRVNTGGGAAVTFPSEFSACRTARTCSLVASMLTGWFPSRCGAPVGSVLLTLLTSKSDRVRELFLLQSHLHTTFRKTYETFSCEPFSFGASLPGAQRTLPTNLSLSILLSDAAHSPRAEFVVLDGEGHKCRRRGRCRRRWWNHAGSVQS